jgi:acyl-coenzyme A synthetase/AMP-(fatty) acid ligase/alkanesulfonate monooxygenase SsuD/methylene tetrahydromethanopterin reductase-like flavin-dependent oxidoreductase (luciferase family)
MTSPEAPGLRVGLRLPQYASSWPDLREAAIRAESLGFASAWLNDHLWTPGRLTRDDAFDVFTGLAAVAAVTDRIDLGTAVMSASYRPPALAAKMASVIDVISGGRLVLGIGTGSDAGEHAAYGYPFPEPRERTAGLLQALEVIEAMWTNPDGATLDGLLDDAPCNPPVMSRPRPPILIAAHKTRLLRMAGARADGLFAAFLSPGDLSARVAIARAARTDAGITDPLRVAVYIYALPVRDEQEALEWIAPEAEALGNSPRSYLKWLPSRGLAASPEEIAATLATFAAAGATDAVLVLPNRVPSEAIDALAEVMDVPTPVTVTGSGPGPSDGAVMSRSNGNSRGGGPPPVTVTGNLVDLLVERHRRAGRGGERAVSDEHGTWTYDDLGVAFRRAAGALRATGLRRGQHVAVVTRDGRPWVQAVLGIAAAGGVAIPLDPQMDPGLLAEVLDDAAVTLVVAEEPMPEGPWRVVHPDQLDAGRPAPVTPVNADDLAYIVYSSGSTGRPKGAMHAHRDMRASVVGYSAEVLGLGPGDICHAVSRGCTSLGFGNGFFRPLGRGAHVVHTRTRPNVRTVLHACRDHGVTVLSGVPTFWAQLAEFLSRHPGERESLGSLRLGVSSGDSLPGPVLMRLRGVMPGLDVLEGFGCSEASNIVLSTRPGDDLPGRLGTPVAGSEVSLRNEDGIPVEPGTPGQLWIRAESNTSGYWRRSALTRDLVHGEWVRMSDMLVEEGGVFRHVGRADDLFKVDAKFVSPVQVEGVIHGHPAVRDVAVIGRCDDAGLMRVVAVIVPVEGVDTAEAEHGIRTSVARTIGPYAAPSVIEWRDALPRLSSGKVARRTLRRE